MRRRRPSGRKTTASIQNVELLSEIGKEITASLDLDTILFKLYERVNQIVDASIFGVGLYRPQKNLIEYSLAIENGKRYAPYTREHTTRISFAVWCIDNRKPVSSTTSRRNTRNIFRPTSTGISRSKTAAPPSRPPR